MARPGIEYADVDKAARKMMSQGIHPSVQRVRDALGTGSNTTISKHLKSWQMSFTESNTPSLPASVPEDLMNPLDEFWSTAVARAENNYQSLREALENKVQKAESEKQAARDALEHKTAEAADLTQELKAVKAELSTTKEKWLILRGQNTVTHDELIKSHQEVERLLEVVHDQHALFDTQLTKADHAYQQQMLEERERVQQNENRLMKEIDDLRQTILTHDQAEKTLKQSAHELHERLNQAKRDHSLVETEYQKLKEQLDQAAENNERQTITYEKQSESQQAQLSQSLSIMSKLQLENDTLKKEAVSASQKIDELSSSLVSLQTQLRSKENEHKK